MAKRVLVIFLAILLLLPLAQTARADSSGLCFISLNDTLPTDLAQAVTFVSGSAYVPAKVFSTFGIYYNYFSPDSTAMLYNSNKQVFFNLSNGNSYDSNETILSASATSSNGQVYVPASWVCSYFGLTYSYISGNGYGDVVRIKNGTEWLSDADFLNAATSQMKNKYNEYFGKGETIPPSPTPSATPPEEKESGAPLAFAFLGVPGERLMKALDDYGIKVSFFVTAEEAEQNPDTLRRLYGSGHNLGVRCLSVPESEFELASEILFDAVQIRPTLLTAPAAIEESAKAFAAENGCAFVPPINEISETAGSASAVTSIAERARGLTSFFVPLTEKTEGFIPSVFGYAVTKKRSILQIRETLV